MSNKCGAPLGNKNRRKYFVGDSIPNKMGASVYTLERVEGVKGWFSCSVCSQDIELFPSLFPALSSQIFKKERIICGCSDRYVYDYRQMGVKGKRLCEENDEVFKGVVEYKGCYTKMLRLCANSHLTEINIDQYKRGHNTCPQCVRTFKKVDKNREGNIEYFYVVTLLDKVTGGIYYKIGRTCGLRKRVNAIRQVLDHKYEVSLHLSWKIEHTLLVEIEYDFHSEPFFKDFLATGMSRLKHEIYKESILETELYKEYVSKLEEVSCG